MTSLPALDGNTLLFIQDHIRNPVLTPVMQAITSLGDHGIFWIILTLPLLIPKRTRLAGICSALALIGSLVCNNMIIKNLVARTRPYDLIEGLRILTVKPDDFSFPSGHSGASFASAAALYRTLPRRWGVCLIVLAALIALSRLYVGVHFPTDVICGTIIGIILGLLAVWLVRDRLRPRVPLLRKLTE